MTELKITTTGSGTFGDVVPGWSVTEAATTVNPNISSDGTGLIVASTKAHDDSDFLVDNNAVATHDDLGTIEGLLGDVTVGNTVGLNIQPLLSLLNVERNMPPTGEQPLSEIFAAYVAAVTPQLSVSYQASSDPLRIYPGWSGSVWFHLNQLCAINKVEIASTGSTIVVRDIGSVTKTVDEKQGISRTFSTAATGRNVEVVCQNTVLIGSLPGSKYNYSANPSLETNTTGWSNSWSPVGLAPTFGRVAANPLSGTYSYRMLAVNASSGAGQYGEVRHSISTSTIPDGEQVALSVSAYHTFVSSAPNIYDARIEAYYTWVGGTAGGTGTPVLFGTVSGFSGIRGASARTNFSVTSMPKPAGALFLLVDIRQVSRAPSGPQREARILVGDTIWVDGVLLTNGALIPYADGNTAGWSWNGTTNNSISSTTIPVENDFYNAYTDNNTIYSVNAGEVVETLIQTKNFPTYLAQPIQTTAIPNTVGTYYVSAADNLPVTPAQWADYGGRVMVAIGDVPGTILLTLTGPSMDIPGVPGPYSLSISDGATSYAALSIAGIGVTTRPETLTVATGADPDKTTVEIAATLNSPFVRNLSDAYNAAGWMIVDAAGPSATLSATLGTHQLAGFGVTQGSVVPYEQSRYRIMNANITRLGTGVSARWHVTAADSDNLWAGQSADAFDTFWSGYSAGDYQIKPLRN